MLEGRSLRSYSEAIRKHKASHKFHHDRFLSYSDRMTDGFCARFSSGLVLLDAGIDLTLQRFLATVAALLETETVPEHKVRIISVAIANACGGKYGGAPERLHERMVAAGFELSDLLPIGVLLGDKNSGVGLCHHRALLLKYILDSLEVCPSVLVDASIVVQDCLDDPPCSSEGTDHMWNITRLDQPMFCDIMQAPPVLQQAEDLDRCIVSFMEPKCVLDICFGTVVEVLSQSTGSWMAGRVTIPWSTNRITVEFVFAGMLCMKHVRPNSRSWRKLSQDAASDSDAEHDPGAPKCQRPQGEVKHDNVDTLLQMHGYSYLRKLGQGGFGTAILVNQRSGKRVIKMIDVGGAGKVERSNALKESNLLLNLRSDLVDWYDSYIVRWHDCFESDRYVCIVMEYCEGGDLSNRIYQAEIPEHQITRWLKQALLALKYLHELGVLHRDLKPSNFMLAQKGSVPGDWKLLKMGDFGISKILPNTLAAARTVIGTPMYMSPEALRHEPYAWPSDIWSMGATLYEMCARRRAFSTTDQILRGEIPSIPRKYSLSLNQICKDMLNRDPRKRPPPNDLHNRALCLR
eukprot:gnl/TRDRNA2_/TRDRNA2_175961_c0_seq3.p1 gnl/TRDRNA2_/TRDRNA2_175961_c0~~gnl/TRDRNA2_/TRDRNA2_175961_c0_seq3.p1  ORF type:complete len:575 (+),score=80.93 gnl/TRDRNA2_/TRDRNA2_175961_c0_seq3:97-1821(+)